MNRLFFAIVLLVGYAATSLAGANGPSGAWKIGPPSTSWRSSARSIGEELFFELPLSKATAAVRGELSREASIHLSQDTLVSYVGKHFRCPTNHQPYLVRAPFGHGGTGKFSVYVLDGDVIVNHESLGKTSVVNHSALLVCLTFTPKRIFGVVGIDE